ncbi:lymphocyte function-associated antigen 3 isoform X1 [Danio rerio]|uniref:Lymphocyte function-associated antigen 3 isoform X1 n=1 Tax=Danio rerio TaxID=7955 RepID=A0AB13AA95_DANRE|nr:lymphocyte function-associated antigen 3 isoform X2 [Danio rerio]|eukprot:XP_021334479.1 lymphocyte function-associated antigen 3 isoform X2 [Danio rerio]
MEFVVRVLLFFTCFCFQDFVFCEDYAEMGGRITFTPSIRGKPVEILWKHNGDKVVEYDNRETEEFGSFKDRVVIDFETGQLTIKKLTSQDSGQYQSDITINGKVQSSRHTLTVLDVLPDPRVTCAVNKTSNLQELLCSVDYKTQLQYKWSGPNVIDHPGVKLTISEQQKNSDSVYSCTVKNEVSSKTTDFNLQHCVTGAAARLEVIIPVLIVILFIFLIILAIIIYMKKKSKESEQEKMDPENALSQTSLLSQNERPDEENRSDSPGVNEEEKLLNPSGNEGEQCNYVNSPHTFVAVGNASSQPNVTLNRKPLEDQDKVKDGQREKPEEQKTDNAKNNEKNDKVAGKEKEKKKEQQNTADALPAVTQPWETTIHTHSQAEKNYKLPGEKNKEKNKEENGQPNTELPENTHQDLNRQKTSPAQSDQCRQNHEEEKKPEKRNESGETSDQQQNEGEVTATNEDEQTTGANTQEKDHKETKESHTEGSSPQSDEMKKVKEDTKTRGTRDTMENKQNANEQKELDPQKAEDEKKILEENHEENTERSSLQPAVTEENKEDTKTRGTQDTVENNQNANEQKELDPEKDNMAHQTAEDEKTKQEENHVENTDSASEKQTIQNNSDALSSQNEHSADTEKKSVKPDNNKDNNEAKADHNDDDVESPRKEETTGEKSENYDDNNGEGDESSESKQDMKESNNPPDAGIGELLQDDQGKNPDHEQKIDDRSVPKDEQHDIQSDNFQNQEHQNKQNSTERENKPQHEISPEGNETDRKNSELEEEERQRLQK